MSANKNIFHKMPPVPGDRRETIRRAIISLLERERLSARDISGEVRVFEKEVYAHLDHIQKTISKRGARLSLTPAECKKCGFSFKKREKLKKPGKCPLCRSESIKEPLFSIEKS